MCGIAGILHDNKDLSYKSVQSMINKMHHRGPDAQQIWHSDGVCLGHTRLSIIDLSHNAAQPMTDPTGRYTITFNGEIYNYRELKQLFPDWSWHTSSDTEVILATFARFGTDTPQYLKGQFAFAIWDSEKKSLFMARDRMGEKPLYYYHKDNTFVFASEMRALLASGIVPADISEAGIYDYLVYQSVSAPETIIKDVRMLRAGHYALFYKNQWTETAYFDICATDPAVSDLSYETIKSQVKTLLTASVERQMISDVPLGAFLSGGIDSSIIVGLMASVTERPIHTVSITFDEAKYDESKYSNLIAKRFNTIHSPIRLRASDFIHDIEDYFNDIDVPSGDGPNTWMVSKATKSAGLTVALSGLGGDELFAGYSSFKHFYTFNRLKWFWQLPVSIRRLGLPLLALKKTGNLAKYKYLLTTPSIDAAQVYGVSRHSFSPDTASLLLNGHRYKDSVETGFKKLIGFDNLPLLSQYSALELSNYTQNVLLRDSDNMAMAHSLEIRVPFFDHDLVRYALSVNDRYKYPHTPKQLLVDSMGSLLPSEIVHRPKMGFSLPWNLWLRNELKEICLSSVETLKNTPYFSPKALDDIINSYYSGHSSISWNQVWLLTVIAQWINKIKN